MAYVPGESFFDRDLAVPEKQEPTEAEREQQRQAVADALKTSLKSSAYWARQQFKQG